MDPRPKQRGARPGLVAYPMSQGGHGRGQRHRQLFISDGFVWTVCTPRRLRHGAIEPNTAGVHGLLGDENSGGPGEFQTWVYGVSSQPCVRPVSCGLQAVGTFYGVHLRLLVVFAPNRPRQAELGMASWSTQDG
jgi:hypothetical protein